VDLLPENQEVLDLWHKIKAFGAEAVFNMMDVKMTRVEAEELLERLDSVESIMAEIRASLDKEAE